MQQRPTALSARADGASRFDLAPPRRFILPAILLLLSEAPGHGYALLTKLQGLRFGHVDRPAVYRALGSLEADGLIVAFSQDPTAGQARRVYQLTASGQAVLRSWMGVIKEEHDRLGQVLRRYQSTGTADALLAEVDGGWRSSVGYGWSAVAPVGAGIHHQLTDDTGSPAETAYPADRDGTNRRRRTCRYRIVPNRSAVLIEVRSTAGPVSFGTSGVAGEIEAVMTDRSVDLDATPSAHLELDLRQLSSGNRVYDAELARRIDTRRHPTVVIELENCASCGPTRYLVAGSVTFHGVTRRAEGTVRLESEAGSRLMVAGEQVFDMREFAVPSPTVLMFRMYPDVRVQLHVEAELVS